MRMSTMPFASGTRWRATWILGWATLQTAIVSWLPLSMPLTQLCMAETLTTSGAGEQSNTTPLCVPQLQHEGLLHSPVDGENHADTLRRLYTSI